MCLTFDICVTLPNILLPSGTSVELLIRASLSAYEKKAWRWYTMKSKLVIFNYWKVPRCQLWWIDVCRTFAFLCIKLNINYAQVIFAIFLRNIDLPEEIRLPQSIPTPGFNSVTSGRHSLRYLGPKLWGKLSSDQPNLMWLKGTFMAKI